MEWRGSDFIRALFSVDLGIRLWQNAMARIGGFQVGLVSSGQIWNVLDSSVVCPASLWLWALHVGYIMLLYGPAPSGSYYLMILGGIYIPAVWILYMSLAYPEPFYGFEMLSATLT